VALLPVRRHQTKASELSFDVFAL